MQYYNALYLFNEVLIKPLKLTTLPFISLYYSICSFDKFRPLYRVVNYWSENSYSDCGLFFSANPMIVVKAYVSGPRVRILLGS